MDTMPKSQARAKARKYSPVYDILVCSGGFAGAVCTMGAQLGRRANRGDLLLRQGVGTGGLICKPKRFD